MSLDPPPSIISKFNHNWIQWLSRVHTFVKSTAIYDNISDLPSGVLASTDTLIVEKSGVATKVVSPFDIDGSGNVTIPAAITPDTGIYLGGTATANLLDDYEEGTFSWAISFGGASVGITYTAQAGRYIKIGNKIFVSGRIILSSKGTSIGSAELIDLPFTVRAGLDNYSPPSLNYREGVSFADTYSGYAVVSTNRLLLEETTNAGVVTQLTNNNFTNTADIMVSLNYIT